LSGPNVICGVIFAERDACHNCFDHAGRLHRDIGAVETIITAKCSELWRDVRGWLFFLDNDLDDSIN